MHQEHSFSDLFLSFLLSRSMRIQADLVDQLVNSSEKRLARLRSMLSLCSDYELFLWCSAIALRCTRPPILSHGTSNCVNPS